MLNQTQTFHTEKTLQHPAFKSFLMECAASEPMTTNEVRDWIIAETIGANRQFSLPSTKDDDIEAISTAYGFKVLNHLWFIGKKAVTTVQGNSGQLQWSF